MLEAIGIDKKQFGLHSFCAVVLQQLPMLASQAMSENPKDGYIKDALEERLKVSRNIELPDTA